MEEGSGDGIEGLLALGDGSKKCKSKSGNCVTYFIKNQHLNKNYNMKFQAMMI